MIWLVLLVFLIPLESTAAEFAVAQSAAPTSNGGTQDLTISGFGTPKCALFFGGYGTANGTAVNHAGLWIGAYDGTRQYSMGQASEDNVNPTDTGSVIDANSAINTLLATSQAQDGDGTASFITDGARLTWADAPPSAYLINALLIGGSGVSNCYVGQATGNATQDATTAVSAPGFEPDIVIAWANHALTTQFRPSLGMAWNNGGAVVQRSMAGNDTNGNASATVISALITDRIMGAVIGATPSLELTSFDANGFTVTTRDAAGARDITYIAIKLSGLNAFLHTSAAPTSTGDQSITGVGFRPQVGLMLQGEFAAVDTTYGSNDGEVYGFSVFTATSSATSTVWTNDGSNPSNNESITETAVCRTRKDAADYATCTLVSFDADGATYNYTATNGTARQRAVLYVQASAATRRRGVLIDE